MTNIYWPGTRIVKSQNNAFTAHLRNEAEPAIDQTEDTRECRACRQFKVLSQFAAYSILCAACKALSRVDEKVVAQMHNQKRRHMGVYSRAGA